MRLSPLSTRPKRNLNPLPQNHRRPIVTTKHFGTHDRGALFFYHDTEQASAIHTSQFASVRARLSELMTVKDGNGRWVVELVFERTGPEEDIQVLAYRFTSDWAYDMHEGGLVERGGSLGRGVWEGFREGYFVDRYIVGKKLPVEAPAESEAQ
jgi:hypothetical protein